MWNEGKEQERTNTRFSLCFWSERSVDPSNQSYIVRRVLASTPQCYSLTIMNGTKNTVADCLGLFLAGSCFVLGGARKPLIVSSLDILPVLRPHTSFKFCAHTRSLPHTAVLKHCAANICCGKTPAAHFGPSCAAKASLSDQPGDRRQYT